MALNRVPAGASLPNDFNVIIEIPMNAAPVKYEVDKASGAIFVDRFMSTAMQYPCNYGYIPHTISPDGDPVDVLVVAQFALPTGVVVRCRPVGMLDMEDEAGGDAKVLAVPVPLPYAQNCRFVAPVANAGVTAELPVALNLMEYVPLKLVPTYGELE